MQLLNNGKGAAARGKNAAPSIHTQLDFDFEHQNYTASQPYVGGLRAQLARHGFTLHEAAGPDLLVSGTAVAVLPDARAGWALLRQLRGSHA